MSAFNRWITFPDVDHTDRYLTARVVDKPHRAITTRYRGPGNRRGSRVLVSILGSGKRFVLEWDDALGIQENHDAAALEACRRMNWGGTLRGASVNGGGYLYVVE